MGAVSILIAFGIMMAAPEEGDTPSKQITRFAGPIGFSVASLIFAALTLLGLKTDWQAAAKTGKGGMHEIGMALLTSHSMVFELISFVLLMAIIGALVLARRGRN